MGSRTASGGWAVAVLLLVALPLAAAGDPELADVPRLASAAWWSGLLVVTLQGLLLLRLPATRRAALVGVAVGVPVGALLGLWALVGVTLVAVLVAVWRTVVGETARRAWPALVAAAALVALGQLLSQLDTASYGTAAAGALVQGVGTVGVTTLVASLARSRREVALSREHEVLALRREQAALVEVAVARERTAMARELHDIAAHHLSGIAVMTGAVGRQIDSDPEGAKRAVGEIRAHSRQMLRDLRRLVVLLREDGGATDAADLTGEESLAGVPGLVAAARRTGAEVALAVHERSPDRSPAGDVGPLAQISTYRTVQEALSNAARHAPGAPVEVTVDARDPALVVVRVRSGPARRTPEGTGGGLGLVGMRERAELTGADLDVGPTPDGGWLVELVLRTDPSLTTAPAEEESR